MKWNWGTGIVVGMACFISFILYLVITMSTNKDFHFDLVTESYYAKEMAYQNEIDAETNTNNLTEKIQSKKTTQGWEISFPPELDATKIKGNVFLYRPSNGRLDFEIPMNLSNSHLLIPDNKFINGRWNITIAWNYEGKPYMFKQEIVY